MNQQQPYIHNRGQQIREDFSKANAGIAQGFQALIDDKQKSYDFIVKQNEDVELIKKDLNMYNNDVITKKSNDLLKDTASAIKANGKVDFAKMGEIRRKTAELATAKKNSELSVKAADEVIKLMAQNAPNMKDVTGTYAKIMGSLKDENNLLSPKNAYEEAMKQYRDGIDYIKVGQGRINEQLKMGTPIATSYVNSRGDLVEVKGVIPQGYEFDKTTGQVKPIERIMSDGSKYNPSEAIAKGLFSPEEMEGYKKQIIGAGIMFDSSPINHLTGFINNSFSNVVGEKVIKSAETLQKELNQSEKAKQDAIKLQQYNSPEEVERRARAAEAKIISDQQRGQASLVSSQAAATNAATNVAEYNAKLAGGGFKKDTETIKPSGLFSTTAPSGTIYTSFEVDKRDVEVGVTKKGNVFLKGIDGKPIYDPQKVNKVLNKLPKEKSSALQSLINKQKGGKVSDFTPVSVDVSDTFKD